MMRYGYKYIQILLRFNAMHLAEASVWCQRA